MRLRRHGNTLVDVMIGTLLVALVGVGSTMVAARTRESADRVKCASNLKQIGQAILIYEGDFGEWPRTRYDPATADRPAAWTGADSTAPFAADGPATNDVTAAYRLLLAKEDLVSEVFLCPLSPIADLDFARHRFEREHANFLDERELSYSFANPYPTAAVRDAGYRLSTSMPATFAVASDVNPGVATPESDVTAVTSTDSARGTRRGNSPNHDRDGQNVLYADGHVEFQQSPIVGTARDNIFTYGRRDRPAAGFGVVGSPVDADDSVLLPAVDADMWRRTRGAARTHDVVWVAVPGLLVLAVLVAIARARRPEPKPWPPLPSR